MCMILVKPAGIRLPSEDILYTAGEYNPHGFGFVSDSKVYKSLDLDDFIDKLSTVDYKENLIVHFRLATQGSVKISNCHPFKAETKQEIWMAHNGVLPISPKDDMTDSQLALNSIWSPIIRKYGINSYEFRESLEFANYSRLAFLSKKCLYLYGDWYLYKGCFYSKSSVLHAHRLPAMSMSFSGLPQKYIIGQSHKKRNLSLRIS